MTQANPIPEEHRAALSAALQLLRREDRFEREIRARLNTRGFGESADFVVEYLKQKRMIDDPRVVRSVILFEQEQGAKGIERIRYELINRGADPEMVEIELNGVDLTKITATIDTLVSRKLRRGDSREKAGRFLVGRGFNEDEIESALNRFYN